MPRTFEISGSRLASFEPEDVLGLIADATKWPAWQPEITSIAGPSSMVSGDVARGEARMLGFYVDGHATAVDVLALFLRRRLRWLQRTALENLVRQSEAGNSS